MSYPVRVEHDLLQQYLAVTQISDNTGIREDKYFNYAKGRRLAIQKLHTPEGSFPTIYIRGVGHASSVPLYRKRRLRFKRTVLGYTSLRFSFTPSGSAGSHSAGPHLARSWDSALRVVPTPLIRSPGCPGSPVLCVCPVLPLP